MEDGFPPEALKGRPERPRNFEEVCETFLMLRGRIARGPIPIADVVAYASLHQNPLWLTDTMLAMDVAWLNAAAPVVNDEGG